ncbi:phage terminase large subunit family protein [Thalassospira xiamenensis]|uniref:phage terminase large subunit family protein n=1 Tax=Thalassospira xiamenensis TaxID=220697 RepID=UPI001C688C00|nr:terminase gpA endonuclease subunit [Thalassospira xiamenensis]
MEKTIASALSLVVGAIASGLRPDRIVMPSDWARENLILADGPKAGFKWDPEVTPYAVGILDCLASTSSFTRVTVHKSSQVGLTEAMIAWIGSLIDCAPAKAMVVFPTIQGVQDFNREKLQPTLDQTVALKKKVSEAATRSKKSSTALSKRFPGGSLTLTGANSSVDLRSKTIKYMVCDEIDDWPLDLDGQGDPMEMVDARQIAFHATGDYKKFEASTPTIKGVSRIDDAFNEGDQRYWHCPCPHCGEFQVLEFGGPEKKYGLKFNTEWPYEAHYLCKFCGAQIEHYQKKEMVRAGKWVASNPEPGRHPSFHIDAISSLVTTWDHIADKFCKAKDDPKKLKGFINLWLGQAWEERGDAPEWSRLFARRESYAPRTIPPGGLVFTGGCDVQGDGIYYEVVAWGRDRQSWSIDQGFLTGNTADPSDKVWSDLSDLYARRYPDAYGNFWPVDALAIDSGYNTNQVYMWAAKHPSARAIKGVDGWQKAAISASPSKVDISWQGQRLKYGAMLWQVGTWGLKSELYANLRKQGARDGQEYDPPGFCHFGEFHDEAYFKQLTSEFLKETNVKGRVVKVWHASGPNHLHDCRIYNMAMASHLGVDRFTSEEWDDIVRDRAEPPKGPQGDLIDRMGPTAAAENRTASESGSDGDQVDAGSSWIGPKKGGWLN